MQVKKYRLRWANLFTRESVMLHCQILATLILFFQNLLKKDTTEKLYLCIIELDPKKQSVFNTEKFKNWISTLYDKKTIKFIIQ